MAFRYTHKASVASPGHLAAHVASGATVLIEFAARDAPACRLEEPILSKILRRYADRLAVIQADTESSQADADAFGVTAVPTFLLFSGGKEKLRRVGFQSFDELSRAIDQTMAAGG